MIVAACRRLSHIVISRPRVGRSSNRAGALMGSRLTRASGRASIAVVGASTSAANDEPAGAAAPATKRTTRRGHIKMEIEAEEVVVKSEEKTKKEGEEEGSINIDDSNHNNNNMNRAKTAIKRPRGGGGGGGGRGGRGKAAAAGTAAAASPDLDVPKKKMRQGATVTTTTTAPTTSTTSFSPPDDWRRVLAIIKDMRRVGGAPVDTMGCEKISDDAAPDAKGRRFVTLVSAMLSSQTKDPITHAATARLVEHGCTPEIISNTPEDVLDKLIVPVGFHVRKAGYLRAAANICVEKYGGDIPPDVEGLMELPGVGPKMAYLVMNVGWGVASGICVDVHVHRIAERLGWVPSVTVGKDGSPKKNRTPEDTRVVLESWLPKEEWIGINPLLVGHGQLTCTPQRPKCGECAANELCPAAFSEPAPGSTRKLQY